MEVHGNRKIHDRFSCEKSDLENFSEYSLSEYMPGIQRIVRTDANVRIGDKVFTEDGVNILGEVIYTVLYISDPEGVLTSCIFREDFEKHVDFRNISEYDENCLFVNAKFLPVSFSAKASGARKISARSKFAMNCEIYNNCNDIPAIEYADDSYDCETEQLSRELTTASMMFFDNARVSLTEEISVDEGMPEISNIISADAHICIRSVVCSDDHADIAGDMTFNCLYESKKAEDLEYVCMERILPFKTEADVQGIDGSWSVMADCTLTSLSADAVTDNYGEQKNIQVGFSGDIYISAFKNNNRTVYTDIYSTECGIEPLMCSVKNYYLMSVYREQLNFEDKVRFDLRGISDIVSSTLKIGFGTPEVSDGAVVIPAKGTLSILGTKENGTVEAQVSPVNIKIRADGIPLNIASSKIKWINACSLCRYECVPAGGDLMLYLTVNCNLAALSEETVEAVCGYEKTETRDKKGTCGFTLYYPSEGESVWSVAKSHAVSCERLRAENGIDGDRFDGKKAVILH